MWRLRASGLQAVFFVVGNKEIFGYYHMLCRGLTLGFLGLGCMATCCRRRAEKGGACTHVHGFRVYVLGFYMHGRVCPW